VALGGRQVDQPAVAEQVDGTAVGQRELLDELADSPPDRGEIGQRRMSISTLKWPLLATMAPSFIASKCSRSMTLMSPVR
jgi:hypothetical protein